MSPFLSVKTIFLKEANYEQREKQEIMSLGEESPSDNIPSFSDVQLQ